MINVDFKAIIVTRITKISFATGLLTVIAIPLIQNIKSFSSKHDTLISVMIKLR